jgi:hypothetical protein
LCCPPQGNFEVFGLHPVVVFGTDEQKRRFLPPLIAGHEKACFAVTEPDAGLDTTRLSTRALRPGDRYLISGRKIWTSTAQVAEKMLILVRTTPRDAVAKPSLGPPRRQGPAIGSDSVAGLDMLLGGTDLAGIGVAHSAASRPASDSALAELASGSSPRSRRLDCLALPAHRQRRSTTESQGPNSFGGLGDRV